MKGCQEFCRVAMVTLLILILSVLTGAVPTLNENSDSNSDILLDLSNDNENLAENSWDEFDVESEFPSFEEDSQNGLIFDTDSREKVVSTNCGGVLDGLSGEVQFKYQEPFAAYDTCVWTLFVGNRSTVTVRIVESFSRDHGGHYFQVGYFNKSLYDQPSYFQWTRLPIHVYPQTIQVPGPVVFFQFVTCGAYIGLGFKMAYEAGETEVNSTLHYDNKFASGASGVLKYPEDAPTYQNNQRTTIVVDNPKMNNASFLFLSTVDLEASENCLVDSINIYKYNHTDGKWPRVGLVCGKTSGKAFQMTPVEKIRHDPLILTFKSDETTVGRGFQLWWSNNN